MRESPSTLAALRARIARHAGPPGAVRDEAAIGLGHDAIDAYLDGGLKRAQLHEIFAQQAGEAGAATGFAAMLALRAQPPGRPLLWLRTERAEKRTGRFYAPGFAELGGDPASLLLAIVPDMVALLRGMADALRCAGLGAVIAECTGASRDFDLTASRRLTLAAGESGIPALMVRHDAEPVPSTADTRWAVRAARSRGLAANAPGLPALTVTLLRRRGGAFGRSFDLEWDRDRRVFSEAALFGDRLSLVPRGPAADRERPGERVAG